MIDERILYRVKRPGDIPGAVSLAIGIRHQDGRLQFTDTIHGHNMEGTVQETKDGFTFTRNQEEGPWTFTVLTLEEFNKKIRPSVDGGKYIPKLRSDDDLHEWYRRQFINP